MIWSVSSFKEYEGCQRKWFLNHKAASRSVKDAFRRKVHLLSELESIDAWRGKIVDYTISEFIIPKLNKKQNVRLEDVLTFAKKITRARYEFAKEKKYTEPGLVKMKHQDDYAALYEFEYINAGGDIKEKLKRAWEEIETALINFMGNDKMFNYLKTATYLVAQKSLLFKYSGLNVKGVPDLIVFFSDKPPHIIDWKVHFFGTKSYNEQLLIYATALLTCKPHNDFPEDLYKYGIEDIKLTEYQLLKNTVRHYKVNEEKIESINDFIAEGLHSMQLKKCDEKYETLDIEDFDKTYNLDNCITCAFKKICMEN